MISTANLTIQFGPKPLFENVSVKFGEGNRYGLIGANGSGKSTFMKILGGDMAPTSGNVSIEPNVRLGKLRQDQFAFEEFRVLDTVIMGHARPVAREAGARPDLRAAGDERRRRHARRRPRNRIRGTRRLHGRSPRRRTAARRRHPAGATRRTDERRRARLEAARAARAGAVRRSRRDAARRTDQQPRHQRDPLARRRAQRAQLHDGDHLARSPLPEQRLHAHGRPRLRRAARLSRQLRPVHDGVDAGARTHADEQREEEGADRRPAGVRQPLLGQCVQSAASDIARPSDRKDRTRRGETVAAASAPTSASTRTRSCIDWRSNSRVSPRATMRRCSRTSI